ncbi:MAG: C1 family peptidase [Spirochaetia bacterium]
MKNGRLLRPRSFVTLLCIALFCAATPFCAAQATGLTFTPKDRLRGIPLASTPFSGAELRTSIDLSAELPPPGNQGNQQSCVGWAIAYALKSYQERREEGWPLTDRGVSNPAHVFSPAFIYNQVNGGRDGGCTLPDALDLLHERGAATLADMPYTDSDFRRQPSAITAANARRYRIDYWRQVNVSDVMEVKAQLNAGYPVVIGTTVDQGFIATRRGTIWKDGRGKRAGGHAMVLVGYDDARHAFKLINSWGRSWGDDGYGWVDYDHFRRVVDEGFVAKDAINGPAPSAEAGVPTAAPAQPLQALPPPSFAITNIIHNVQGENGVLWLRLEGTVSLPPGSGKSAQVVNYFYGDAGGMKGLPVPSRSMQFADVNGVAATGTTPFTIPAEGLNGAWWAVIPYEVLTLVPGAWLTDAYGSSFYQPAQNRLVLEPVLFIDGFGVLTGGLVPFIVNQ